MAKMASGEMVFLLLAGMAGCMACGRESKDPVFSKEELQAEMTRDVEILYSDSSVVRIRIQAPSMVQHLASGNTFQEFPKGIHIDFFDAAGRVSSTLRADHASRYPSRKLTFLKRNVRWESVAQEVMEAPELTWNEETRNLYTNKFVVIATPKDTVFSLGFNADQSFGQIQMRAIDGSMELKNKSDGGI